MLNIADQPSNIWYPNWASLDDDELLQAHKAGEEVAKWMQVLAKTDDSPVSDFFRGIEQLNYDEFYPEDTVQDEESSSQYYFHAHSDREFEYGHFHTYVMKPGIPQGIRAVNPAPTGDHDDRFHTHCHLVAVVMSDKGFPESLFTINQWSSHEAQYSVDQIMRILDRFDISHAVPSFPTNQWIGALLRLYRPQIRYLMEQREAAQKKWKSDNPESNPIADEQLEVTSQIGISIDTQIAKISAEIRRRHMVNVDKSPTMSPQLA